LGIGISSIPFLTVFAAIYITESIIYDYFDYKNFCKKCDEELKKRRDEMLKSLKKSTNSNYLVIHQKIRCSEY